MNENINNNNLDSFNTNPSNNTIYSQVQNKQNLNNQFNQNINFNPQSINNNKNKQKKKNQILILCIITTLILIFSGILLYYLFNKNQNDIAIDKSITVTELLWQDYKNGNLTTDEYVKNILYSEFDRDLLDNKYQLVKNNDLIHTDHIINKYYNELSEETLKYYLDKINLNNITFELSKENEDADNKVAISNLFVDTVYAKSKDTPNLNKAILSSNGNFVVWYTTTGDSATDYTSAKKVADGLEKTISLYKEKFGYDYYYKSNIFSKGSRYKDQIKILENSNIDSKYLESAMQVYLVNYNDGSLAKYMGNSGTLVKLWNGLSGGDSFGVVANPYILIKPSSFDDYERLEQLYNHELFHHYQHEILCGHSSCSVGSDPYILEASANWASSLVSSKTTNSGYLNEWASSARMLSDSLLSDESIEKYSEGTLGYTLYVYLYHYSTIVSNGTNKIINSIYTNDLLGYLIDNATKDELADIQEAMSLKNLSQDYGNKNLNSNLDYNPTLPIRATISHNDEKFKSNNTYYNYLMSPISQNYYLINDNSDYAYQIHLERDYSEGSKFISATIIKFYNGKFSIVDSSKNSNESYTFNTNNYGDYDSLYIVISNTYTNRKNSHVLNVKEIKKEQQSKNEDNNYISLVDCNAWNEYLDKSIATYYYDSEEKIIRYIVTNIWTDLEEAKINYENSLTNSNYKNVNQDGKIVAFEYTQEALEKYFSNQTKSSVISGHNMSCDANAEIDFTPSIK